MKRMTGFDTCCYKCAKKNKCKLFPSSCIAWVFCNPRCTEDNKIRCLVCRKFEPKKKEARHE